MAVLPDGAGDPALQFTTTSAHARPAGTVPVKAFVTFTVYGLALFKLGTTVAVVGHGRLMLAG